MIIKNPAKEDLEEVNTMIRDMHLEISKLIGKILNEEDLRDEEIDETEFSNVLIAEFDGRIAGYISFSKEPEKDKWYGKHLYVYELYTRPEFRKKGIASALLDEVIKKAEEQNLAMKLDTFYVNERTMNLVKKKGFKQFQIYFIKEK